MFKINKKENFEYKQIILLFYLFHFLITKSTNNNNKVIFKHPINAKPLFTRISSAVCFEMEVRSNLS